MTGNLAISVGVAVGGISVEVGVGSSVGALVDVGDGSGVVVGITCGSDEHPEKMIRIRTMAKYAFFMVYILTGF